MGMIVYFPACLFVPKVAIYETAETDGMYYEGMHDYMRVLPKGHEDEALSERTRVGTISDVFREGYIYAESKVVKERTEKYFEYRSIPPLYYCCTPLPKNPKAPAYEGTDCIVIDQPMSRFMVRVATKTIVQGVETNIKQVIDRSTGKLMAEYHRIVFNPTVPFFNWLYPADHYAKGGAQSSCPTKPSYYDFEYRVLRPIK